MNITEVKYQRTIDDVIDTVVAVIDGVKMTVGMSEQNRHYAEIMRQVEAGTLTIADAD
jgi:hypothetical protein